MGLYMILPVVMGFVYFVYSGAQEQILNKQEWQSVKCEPGFNLVEFAYRVGVPLEKIVSCNRLPKNLRLQPGMILKYPHVSQVSKFGQSPRRRVWYSGEGRVSCDTQVSLAAEERIQIKPDQEEFVKKLFPAIATESFEVAQEKFSDWEKISSKRDIRPVVCVPFDCTVEVFGREKRRVRMSYKTPFKEIVIDLLCSSCLLFQDSSQVKSGEEVASWSGKPNDFYIRMRVWVDGKREPASRFLKTLCTL